MKSQLIIYTLKILIAAVWLLNGLYCKILDYVPRHEQIVGILLSDEYASVLTDVIGAGEVLIGIWVLSGWKSKWCAISQIVLIITMNLIEFSMVPELLLHGRWNLIFALLFVIFIYVVYFKLASQKTV